MPFDLTTIREYFNCSNCPPWKHKQDGGNGDNRETNGRDNDRYSFSDCGEQETEEEPGPIKYFPHNSSKPERHLSPLPLPPTDDNLGIYKALWPFDARAEEELSFETNDLFRVKERSGDWWKAEKLVNGEVVASGVVPYNYLVKGETLQSQLWYFGKLSRFEAENLLITSTNPEGVFLVRRSEKDEVGYVLSVKTNDKVKHFKIIEGEGGFYVVASLTFPDVEALVTYYRSNLLSSIQLTEACVRRKPEPRDLSHKTVEYWERPKTEFTLDKRLGAGHFAEVYRGKWKGGVDVAIKVLKKNDALDHREFHLETQMLKRLRHKHLISLYAVSTDDMPFYIITELMAKGDLLTFLRDQEGQSLDLLSLTDMAIQVSEGMAYLESENSIHRDLAARNVLVGEGNICKVADFGLARVIKEPFYISDDKTIPFKWTAPEAISHGQFSHKSDVWSFGILLFEIFSYGSSPYPTYANHQIFDLITSGYRMPCPSKCPRPIHDIMLNCWGYSPEERPDFKELRSDLESTRRYDE